MRVIDPGHTYALMQLDGDGEEILRHVKREGAGYPGNVGHYPGTNIQEVLRAEIDRIKYLDNQIHDSTNGLEIKFLRWTLRELECRAAFRHSRPTPVFNEAIELMLFCRICGHIGCNESCQRD
jgi:hypothetical protein